MSTIFILYIHSFILKISWFFYCKISHEKILHGQAKQVSGALLLLPHGQAKQVSGVLLLLPHGHSEQVSGALLLLPHGHSEQVSGVLLLLPHGQAEQVSGALLLLPHMSGTSSASRNFSPQRRLLHKWK